ncbi:hypothetical protein HK098_001889 [Nowakowskiella sp. JEL0407]|nr:hypothetical protein HK098_001889 [Nowakowskiella sp. JEL0407]
MRVPDHGTGGFKSSTNDKGSFLSKIIPREFWSRVALILATSQFIIVGAITAIILKLHTDQIVPIEKCKDLKYGLNCYGNKGEEVYRNATAITIYHGIFILAQGFQMVLAFDAVLNSSMMQLMSTTLFNIALFGYSIISWFQADALAASVKNTVKADPTFVPHRTNIYEIVVIALMGLYSALWILSSIRLYKVFGWSIFKELGADIAVRRQLTLYYVYMMLLKLDVFFFIGFIGQYLLLVLLAGGYDNLAWINGGVALPLAVVLLVIAYYAIKRESNILMILTLIGLSGVMGYLVTRLVDIYVSSARYTGSKNSLTFFVIITILLCLATFVIAILNFRNFGKGLMDQYLSLKILASFSVKSRGNSKGHLQLDDLGRHPPPHTNRTDQSKWNLE